MGKLILLLIVAMTLISSAGTVLGAEEDSIVDTVNDGNGGGMKLTTSTFTSGMSWSQLDPVMPIATMILLFCAFVYGLSCFSGIFASGTKTNLGAMLKSNDLRNEGQKGYLSIIGGAILMAVSFILIFVIWNNYGLGAW